ncbi:hypothetical protein [Myxococcus llanfairpwllgwyngyllgogerychwyrndrobwllllantysiliogogogochensis]|nr:hypothetical protein [Myxococcus llanfairpwllgwyngyllgogerychwyrndrobwllllantysiliogogogochensis]
MNQDNQRNQGSNERLNRILVIAGLILQLLRLLVDYAAFRAQS